MKKKGMTLIELIVSIAIIGIVMLFVAASMRPILQSYGAQQALNESKDIANNTLAIIKNEIRDAKGTITIQPNSVGCDSWITYDAVSIIFGGEMSNGLPKSYYQGHSVWVRFSTTESQGINVDLEIDKYEINSEGIKGGFKPHKPGLIGQVDAGGPCLCIKKEASTE